MVRLDTLPQDHPLRNAPLADIGATYKWIYSKGKPRPVLRAFGIARNSFNQLGQAWTEQYEWYAGRCGVTEIRKFPETDKRVETGPIQFGDDWPGVFIRGDSAAYYAMILRDALMRIDKASQNPIIDINIASLARLLDQCNLTKRA